MIVNLHAVLLDRGQFFRPRRSLRYSVSGLLVVQVEFLFVMSVRPSVRW